MTKKISDEKDIAPDNLNNHPFYGLVLDEQQKAFRDAIWSKEKLIVFADAKAGSGKTLISVMTGNLLIKYGRYNGMVYIASPVQEQKVGFLPGDAEDKAAPYFMPFYQACIKAGVNPYTDIIQSNMLNQKNGTGYIECTTHVYLRGTNFENKVIIIDEAQNMFGDELKKTLTRINDDCKVIVIGHSGQIDIFKHPERSGFVKYLDHFKDDSRCAVCELSHNYRGWISSHADELEFV